MPIQILPKAARRLGIGWDRGLGLCPDCGPCAPQMQALHVPLSRFTEDGGPVEVPGRVAAARRRRWGWAQVEPASIRARASFGSRAMTAMVIQQSTWGFVVWRSKTQRYPAGSPELDSR